MTVASYIFIISYDVNNIPKKILRGFIYLFLFLCFSLFFPDLFITLILARFSSFNVFIYTWIINLEKAISLRNYVESRLFNLSCWLVGLVLWHINLCSLFNAKSIFMKIVLFQTIQFIWNITFRLFSVISRTLVNGGCREAFDIFYSPSRLGNKSKC